MFDRITARANVLSGKPCVKGTRLSVAFLMELFASGGTREQILQKYPELTNDDLSQVLAYAARAVDNDIDAVIEIAR